MSTYKGFISTIIARDVPARGHRPASKAYSFKIELENGDEAKEWFGYGFKEPPFKEGAYVQFDAETNANGFLTVIEGTGSSPKNPPARKSARQSSSGAVQNGSSSGTAQSTAGTNAAAVATATSNGEQADRQTQIVMQHSQEIAVRVVVALLANNGLPMTGAATKAGEAKRFSEVTAMIDKLTVRYYNDVVTARLLDIVADTVPSKEPDGPLPTGTPNTKAAGKNVPASAGDDLADGEVMDSTEYGADDNADNASNF